MIHQYARHTNYNDSGDKCYKNIQKVQEKRQLQQTTELCITGRTMDWCWDLANCALSVAEERAGRPQAVWPGGLAAAGHGLLNTANMLSIT